MAAKVTQEDKLARALAETFRPVSGGSSGPSNRRGVPKSALRRPVPQAGEECGDPAANRAGGRLPVAQIALGKPEVVLRLKVHPELSRSLEKTREQNSRLGSHATLAVDDRVYPLDRDL